jgi:predicted TIM-barrel fold metal-dependent hydrolase
VSLVDVHHHIVPPAFAAAERDEILHFAGGDERVLDWSPAQALETLDREGIATAYTSLGVPGTPDPRVARECNEQAAELARGHPDRFGVFATLPMGDLATALAELEYAFDALGADGIGLLTNERGVYLGDPVQRPLLEELDRRRAVVHVHPVVSPQCRGASGEGLDPFLEFPFDTARCAASLLRSGALERFPGIQFILSHGGGPTAMLAQRMAGLCERAGRPADPAALRRLHVDAVTSTRPEAFSLVRGFFGDDHIVFGSDHPYVPVAVTAGGLHDPALGLGLAARAAIEAGNARALLGAD